MTEDLIALIQIIFIILKMIIYMIKNRKTVNGILTDNVLGKFIKDNWMLQMF